ncbi:Rv3654c family TadE-like protein [Nonomuraea sp. 3N208]|uniref:Rv3654c family TadE-like protein n=1 Tax=Nonomuraea sp. 3N208 TaxID=3457421 RepID=UPI003FD3FE42
MYDDLPHLASNGSMASTIHQQGGTQGEVEINPRERGSATLWGVALMGLLMAVATAFATVGAARVARHRVNNAADMSALAAARLALFDPEGACARAAALAAQNGVELTRCEINDEVADVWTSLPISLPIVGTHTVMGRSRAGPAEWTPPDNDDH